jgi:ketosteroid isomerase-like protein
MVARGIVCWFRAKVSDRTAHDKRDRPVCTGKPIVNESTNFSRGNRSQFVSDPKYAAFSALDPFFEISKQGLAGLVDGNHYFDTIADDAGFEFRYNFPGWPQRLNGREALMALYAVYGNSIVLHGADALVIHRSQDPRVVIIEYEVHGKIVATGASYDNRFISVVAIEDRKIVHWRDYMDSLAAMTALSQTSSGAGSSK